MTRTSSLLFDESSFNFMISIAPIYRQIGNRRELRTRNLEKHSKSLNQILCANCFSFHGWWDCNHIFISLFIYENSKVQLVINCSKKTSNRGWREVTLEFGKRYKHRKCHNYSRCSYYETDMPYCPKTDHMNAEWRRFPSLMQSHGGSINDLTRIYHYLYLGSHATAKQKSALMQMSITHLVSIGKGLKASYNRTNLIHQ